MTKATDSKTEAKATDASSSTRAPKADPAKDETAPPPPAAPAAARSDCAVKSDFHVGRAVNGQVCSYHAMQYRADGTPR